MAKNILCVIGARGGSKGVPGKNIMDMAGKPLIAWTIERALAVDEIANVVVSTDDEAIAEVARRYGADVPFMRPADLATAEAGKFGVWKHALAECEKIYGRSYDIFLDMDCTTPLLDADDVRGIIRAFKAAKGIDGMFTVAQPHRNPYFNQVEEDGNGIVHLSKTLPDTIVRRQDAPQVWDIVAGLYIFTSDHIRKADHWMNGKLQGYEVPRAKSFDIDEKLDADMVEWLMKRKLGI